MDEQETIQDIVTHCGTPMVWTFKFFGAEWYCVKCGDAMGILGDFISVRETPELLEEKKRNEDLFKEASGDLIPRGARFKDCKKCNTENHSNHSKQEDLVKSDDAYKILACGISDILSKRMTVF